MHMPGEYSVIRVVGVNGPRPDSAGYGERFLDIVFPACMQLIIGV